MIHSGKDASSIDALWTYQLHHGTLDFRGPSVSRGSACPSRSLSLIGRQMMSFWQPSRETTSEERRIIRAHWEWAGRYAILWIIGTVVIFGGISFVLDFLGADDAVRIPSLLLLATITIVNAIWRAVGALAARIELMLSAARNRANP
jgi:hypothetical protein